MIADVSAAITLPVGLEDFKGPAILLFQTNETGKFNMGSVVVQRGRSRGSLIVAVDPRWNPESASADGVLSDPGSTTRI